MAWKHAERGLAPWIVCAERREEIVHVAALPFGLGGMNGITVSSFRHGSGSQNSRRATRAQYMQILIDANGRGRYSPLHSSACLPQKEQYPLIDINVSSLSRLSAIASVDDRICQRIVDRQMKYIAIVHDRGVTCRVSGGIWNLVAVTPDVRQRQSASAE